jgi:hypothetical protein
VTFQKFSFYLVGAILALDFIHGCGKQRNNPIDTMLGISRPLALTLCLWFAGFWSLF